MNKKIDLNDSQTAFEYKSDKELKKSLFIYGMIQKPAMVKMLSKVALWIINYRLPFKFLLKNTVFEVFCAGVDREQAQKTISHLKKHQVNTVLDYVAEGDKSEVGYEKNLEIILANIQFVAKNNSEGFVGVKLSGLEDVDFIETVSFESISKNPQKHQRIESFMLRIDEICKLGAALNVKIYFDAEERRTQDVYDFVVEKMMEKYNRETVLIYNTLQMYFTDRLEYLNHTIEEAKRTNSKLGIKLVRGAYVEKEREYATEKGIKNLVFENKSETDEAFNSAIQICLKNHEMVHTCLATHNMKSISLAIEIIQEYGIEDQYHKVFFSQLYGMSDNLTFNLAKANYNSSKYVPYGEVEKAIPYLLRRAEENSSIEGQASREYELLLQEKKRRKL